jgi:hypothetical protein
MIPAESRQDKKKDRVEVRGKKWARKVKVLEERGFQPVH